MVSGSKDCIDHPPWANPPSVSSWGPPGACTTPSRLMNSLITMRMSGLRSCRAHGRWDVSGIGGLFRLQLTFESPIMWPSGSAKMLDTVGDLVGSHQPGTPSAWPARVRPRRPGHRWRRSPPWSQLRRPLVDVSASEDSSVTHPSWLTWKVVQILRSSSAHFETVRASGGPQAMGRYVAKVTLSWSPAWVRNASSWGSGSGGGKGWRAGMCLMARW